MGYRIVKKNYDDMLSRFHLIPERHGQTDRQTDGRTDRQLFYVNIARQYADRRATKTFTHTYRHTHTHDFNIEYLVFLVTLYRLYYDFNRRKV